MDTDIIPYLLAQIQARSSTPVVPISALKGEGLPLLLEEVERLLFDTN
jgi:translation initiation factor IF-2